MEKRFTLIFDNVILKQLQKAAKNQEIKQNLKKMLDKIEVLGPVSGNLLDSKMFLYEIKNKRPPLRLYFKHNKINDQIYVFEFEMKTSDKKQKETINKLRKKNLES